MKKNIFVLFCISGIFISANAQKKSILLGGDFSFEHQSNSIQTSNQNQIVNSLVLRPVIGYQFSGHFTAGLAAGLAYAKFDNVTNIQQQNGYSAGPFIRYTKKLSDIFFIYGQMEARIGGGKNSVTYSNNIGTDYSQKFSQSEIAIFPAIYLDIHKGFGLNFTIGGVSYLTYKTKGENASSAIGITFGKSLGIGISKNFN